MRYCSLRIKYDEQCRNFYVAEGYLALLAVETVDKQKAVLRERVLLRYPNGKMKMANKGVGCYVVRG